MSASDVGGKHVLPPGKAADYLGTYELEGLCIWLNAESLGTLDWDGAAVLAHEFAHYVQAVASGPGATFLLDLFGSVHAGMMCLEDLGGEVELPLRDWARRSSCPEFAVELVKRDEQRLQWYRDLSRAWEDRQPDEVGDGELYSRDGCLYVQVDGAGRHSGVPVGYKLLGEGMAVASECEIQGGLTPLELHGLAESWHYVAAFRAVQRANPHADVVLCTKLLCDLSLCCRPIDEGFRRGLELLSGLGMGASDRATVEAFEGFFDTHCRANVEDELKAVTGYLDRLPHASRTRRYWPYLVLDNSRRALRARLEEHPLCLAYPHYTPENLLTLTQSIGSPVILTNNMHLYHLYPEPDTDVHRASFLVRSLSYICYWLMVGAGRNGGRMVCPYAGCPGCMPECRSEWCRTDARRVIALYDGSHRCSLIGAALNLRVGHLIRRHWERASGEAMA